MNKCLMAICVLLAGASMAQAAIIYEPVQYQYFGPDGRAFYYGGRHMHTVAQAVKREYALRYTDSNYSPNTFIHRGDQVPAVFSDDAPYMNLSNLGYRPVDTANEANAHLPRYFQMSDLVAAGHYDAYGHLIVPANAHPMIQMMPMAQPATMPAPHAIIIIPKSAPKAPAEAATKVVDAR